MSLSHMSARICCLCIVFFFFKQKTAYEMRISDWSSDVCSSDLLTDFAQARLDMFESGLFGQGNAFWRWIATDEARPYLAAFAADRAPPSGSEFFAADLTAEDLQIGRAHV